MQRRIIWPLMILMLMVFVPHAAPASAGSWVTGSASTSSGSRSYKLWVPSGYQAGTPTPLVMLLHGCTQSPDDFAAGTGMNTVADANTFLVVYPEQPSSVDSLKCWQWWDTSHQRRGSGEPAILAAIANKIKTTHNVQSSQVYVAGLSAGGAMTAIMGATYPDIFKAIGVASGLEYKATTSRTNAYTAMSQGGPNPNTQGYAAYQAMGSAKARVPTIVFHGTSDYTVYPVNGDQVLTQWAQTNDYVDDGSDNNSVNNGADVTTNGMVPGGRAYTRYQYNDAAGVVLLEKWMIQNMGHAWSGGSTAGSYTDPQGPNASAEMWRFFTQTTGGGTTPSPTPTSPPASTATPTAPPAGTATPAPPTVVPPTPTAPPSATTVTFTSRGAEDGYAAATLANGTTGGYAVASNIYAGDNADAPFRGMLSFDTSAIPDGATITGVTLRLYATQAPVGAPWSGLGSLVGDVRTGCFGSTCSLVASDFQATASANHVVTLTSANAIGGAGTLVSGTFNATGRTLINKTGTTQIKIRFQNISNNNGLTDYLLLAGGEYSTSSYRPVLVVTYQ